MWGKKKKKYPYGARNKTSISKLSMVTIKVLGVVIGNHEGGPGPVLLGGHTKYIYHEGLVTHTEAGRGGRGRAPVLGAAGQVRGSREVNN